MSVFGWVSLYRTSRCVGGLQGKGAFGDTTEKKQERNSANKLCSCLRFLLTHRDYTIQAEGLRFPYMYNQECRTKVRRWTMLILCQSLPRADVPSLNSSRCAKPVSSNGASIRDILESRSYSCTERWALFLKSGFSKASSDALSSISIRVRT